MKFLRLAAILLTTVMLAAAFPSCGDVTETTFTVAVIVKSPKYDDRFGTNVENQSVILGTTHCTIKTKAGEKPTLLEAITTALEQENIRYTTDEYSITSIKNSSERYKTEKFKYVETDAFGNEELKEVQQRYVYYWTYTVKHEDGQLYDPNNVAEGEEIKRPSELPIENGDHIVFYYTPTEPTISGDFDEGEVDDIGDDNTVDE